MLAFSRAVVLFQFSMLLCVIFLFLMNIYSYVYTYYASYIIYSTCISIFKIKTYLYSYRSNLERKNLVFFVSFCLRNKCVCVCLTYVAKRLHEICLHYFLPLFIECFHIFSFEFSIFSSLFVCSSFLYETVRCHRSCLLLFEMLHLLCILMRRKGA